MTNRQWKQLAYKNLLPLRHQWTDFKRWKDWQRKEFSKKKHGATIK